MGFNGKLAQKALEYGFTGFGVCGTKPFDEWKKANEERNKNGHGRLIPIIHDPKEIMADAKALIVFSYPYHPFGSIPKGSVAISPYYFANAKADIAHKKLLSFMEECGYRAIDGNRLPLKAAAVRAGLGSYTKHGLVMNEDTGTYMVLKAILTNTSDFECTEKSQSICVSCDRCVTHCPTGAIMPDGHININLCLREMMRPNQKIPVQYFEKFGNCVLGCEACQLCCPYNPITSDEYTEEMAKLFSIETILSAEGERLQEVKAGFLSYLGKEYSDFENIKSHTIIAAGNTKDKCYLPLLREVLKKETGTNKTYALWAIANITKNNLQSEETK